jgi:predicted DNA-binding transcriptional regulator AlpA
MSAVVTRTPILATAPLVNYRGTRRSQQPMRTFVAPTELHISEFAPDKPEVDKALAYLGHIAGVEVCQFTGKGCTLTLYGAISVEGITMHQQLTLGDASHRFSSGSVKTWIESLGLPKTREGQPRTSRSTGDIYKTIVFGLQSAESGGNSDAF